MMKSVAAVALLACGANAFAPVGAFTGSQVAARQSSKSVVKMALGEAASELIGASAPVGEWDPAGLSKGKDAETMAWYRAAEIKHGRVCMLAAVGILVQGYFQLPDAVFSNAKPIDALVQVYSERPGAVWQILIGIAAVEVLGASIQKYTAPGDLTWDPLGIKPEDPAELEAMQLKELKNGRLAMLATAGFLYQETLTGQGAVEQITSGHLSPFGDGQGAF